MFCILKTSCNMFLGTETLSDTDMICLKYNTIIRRA